MNIEFNKTSDLAGVLQITLERDDYELGLNNSLREIKKRVEMPGFRKGHVPIGMIKRMYGETAAYEEVNKIISKALEKYYHDNESELLVYPIPKTDTPVVIDINSDKPMIFNFDIGLKPEFDINFDESYKAKKYKVNFSEKNINDMVESFLKPYYEYKNVKDDVKPDDFFVGTIEQLDDKQNILPDGIKKEHVEIIPTYFIDETTKKMFENVKKGDTLVFNLQKALNAKQAAMLLNMKEEDVEKINSDFKFTITLIQRLIKPTINKSFFEKHPDIKDLKNEKGITEFVLDTTNSQIDKRVKTYYLITLIKELREIFNFKLDEDFIKRYVIFNDNEITDAQYEKDKNDIIDSFTNQIIENVLAKKLGVVLTSEELKEEVISSMFFGGQSPHHVSDELKKHLDSLAEKFIQDNKKVSSLERNLLFIKLANIIIEKLNPIEEDIDFDNFTNLTF